MTANKDQLRPRLRLRTEEFDRLARALLGEDTNEKIARRLGTHPTVLSQYRTHNRYVPSEFVAAVKQAMPDVPMDAVFEATEERAA